MALWGNTDLSTDKPKYLTDGNKDITYGVDLDEALVADNRSKGIKTPGWVKYVEYNDAQSNLRRKPEILVAFSHSKTQAIFGDAADDSVIADPTPPGPVWTAPSGFTGYYAFNGTNQRLSTPGSANLSPGTGDFTIEFIINKQNSGGFPRVFSVGSYPTAKVACSIEGGAHVYFWINGSIAADVDCSALDGFPAFQNNWHHVVLQRASGKCQIYVDGNKVGNSTTGNSVNIDCSTAQLNIACESGAGGTYQQFLNGYVTNFRWTTAAVYPDASFSVPSAQLASLAQTKLLLTMSTSGTGLDDTNGNVAAHTMTALNTPVYYSYP